MNPETDSRSDRRLEAAVGNILRIGVMAAAAIVTAGGILYLVRHGREAISLNSFTGEPKEFSSVSGIARAALSGRGRGLIQLGLLILIATPVLRVALSVVGFALERDRLYAAVTLLVLGFLLFSLFGSG
jgi:uncharacterized membrane protein